MKIFFNLIGKAIETLDWFAPFVFALAIFLIFFAIALYVYTAFAFMEIAKKLKYDKPWLAWIPVANIFLIPILAKKHWAWGFMFFVPFAGFVFLIIWTWKIFELRKYPGELSLVLIGITIPFVSFFALIAYLVILGFVAWKNVEKNGKKSKK